MQVSMAAKQATDNFSVVVDRTPAAVMNMPGAQQQITTSKQYIEQSVQTVARTINEVVGRIDEMVRSKANVRNDIDAKRQEVEQVKKDVLEAQGINTIRKEQAEALKTKYGSSYHTSWLGLWRPLSDQSITGLMIASALFILITIITVFFYFQTFQISNPFKTSSALGASGAFPVQSGADVNFRNFTGGFFKRK